MPWVSVNADGRNLGCGSPGSFLRMSQPTFVGHAQCERDFDGDRPYRGPRFARFLQVEGETIQSRMASQVKWEDRAHGKSRSGIQVVPRVELRSSRSKPVTLNAPSERQALRQASDTSCCGSREVVFALNPEEFPIEILSGTLPV